MRGREWKKRLRRSWRKKGPPRSRRPSKVGSGRPLLAREFAGLEDRLAVGDDFAAGVAQIADHVPVQSGVVGAAGFGISRSECRVAGAADLLIEERVFRVLLDAEV